MKRLLLFALMLIGFSAMTGQIVLMRELMTVFYGNELSLGAMLAAWLFWTGVGGGLLGRLADRLHNPLRALILGELALFLLLPATLIGVRSTRFLLGATPGEIIGLVPMFYTAFLLLAPVCLLSGFLFSLGCRLYADRYAPSARGVGAVYVLESIGASVGGLLCGLLLIRVLDPFAIVFGVGLLNAGSAGALWLRGRMQAPSPVAVCLAALTGAALVCLGLLGGIEQRSARLQWRGLHLVRTLNSVYGNIAVVRTDDQHSFFENGLLVFTTQNLLPAEEAVHFPMLSHPQPTRVLLIGGGLSGALDEALKYPLEALDYVELDPKLIQTARAVLPDSLLSPLRAPQVRVFHTDGRLFVKQTPRRYDVVIVMLPQPLTAQINRFYTVEFFREVKAVLAPGGVISFGVTTSENYISPEQARFMACLRVTLSNVFAHVAILPGGSAYFLASDAPLTRDPDVLVARLNARGVSARFVREYYLPYTLSPQRLAYVDQRVAAAGPVRLNRDYAPVGYLYDMVLWSTYFHPQAKERLGALLTGLGLGWAVAPVALLFIAGLLLILTRSSPPRMPVVLAVGTTGFSEILFQVVVIISFQVLYGYVYYKLGLILASFMVGLVLGSLWVNRIAERLDNPRLTFLHTQIAICLYPLVLLGVLYALAGLGRAAGTVPVATAFAFLPVVAGFIGGFQFPLAAQLLLSDPARVGRTAGLLYGVDLLGSCLGALVASAVLIPILGLPRTCLLATMLNAAVLGLLTAAYRRTNP